MRPIATSKYCTSNISHIIIDCMAMDATESNRQERQDLISGRLLTFPLNPFPGFSSPTFCFQS